jgi:putative addiction module killer protein
VNVTEREVKKLVLSNGEVPFDRWFGSLNDVRLQAAVDARIARLRAGNFGDVKSVGDEVRELRIDKWPGLRIYIGMQGASLVILLGGGDKSTQARDIKRARQLWNDFKAYASKKI